MFSPHAPAFFSKGANGQVRDFYGTTPTPKSHRKSRTIIESTGRHVNVGVDDIWSDQYNPFQPFENRSDEVDYDEQDKYSFFNYGSSFCQPNSNKGKQRIQDEETTLPYYQNPPYLPRYYYAPTMLVTMYPPTTYLSREPAPPAKLEKAPVSFWGGKPPAPRADRPDFKDMFNPFKPIDKQPKGPKQFDPAAQKFASLHVGDLDPSIREFMLFELFSSIGQIDDIKLCRDATTGRSLGVAYIKYKNPDDIEKAFQQRRQFVLNGRPCFITRSLRSIYDSFSDVEGVRRCPWNFGGHPDDDSDSSGIMYTPPSTAVSETAPEPPSQVDGATQTVENGRMVTCLRELIPNLIRMIHEDVSNDTNRRISPLLGKLMGATLLTGLIVQLLSLVFWPLWRVILFTLCVAILIDGFYGSTLDFNLEPLSKAKKLGDSIWESCKQGLATGRNYFSPWSDMTLELLMYLFGPMPTDENAILANTGRVVPVYVHPNRVMSEVHDETEDSTDAAAYDDSYEDYEEWDDEDESGDENGQEEEEEEEEEEDESEDSEDDGFHEREDEAEQEGEEDDEYEDDTDASEDNDSSNDQGYDELGDADNQDNGEGPSTGLQLDFLEQLKGHAEILYAGLEDDDEASSLEKDIDALAAYLKKYYQAIRSSDGDDEVEEDSVQEDSTSVHDSDSDSPADKDAEADVESESEDGSDYKDGNEYEDEDDAEDEDSTWKGNDSRANAGYNASVDADSEDNGEGPSTEPVRPIFLDRPSRLWRKN